MEGTAREEHVEYKVRDDIMIYEPGMRMNRNVEKDMTEEDQKSLIFTSDVLPKEMELTGIPNLELYVCSTHTDGNFIAVLEEVTEDGSSHFLTEGFIRASHAKTESNGVYESLGLSYHRGYREDVVELKKEEPLKLCFHLEALSRVLHKGSRLRLAISCGGSGFRQPDGFLEEAPVITLYTGKQYPSGLRLPVIRPTATEFSSGSREVYAYKKAVYIKENGKFRAFPCQQVYPAAENTLVYEKEKFCLTVRTEGQKAYAKIADADYAFEAETVLKDRFYFAKAEEEIPLPRHPWSYYPKVDRKNLYVATVPVGKGCMGERNPQIRSTFDLYIDLIYPENEKQKLPCIINIHGFGGNHHQFERISDAFLKKGYAVASIDYRLCPPSRWPASDHDAKGCIRYLKAHAEELGLDKNRFGVIGGSMGGNLASMLAASNGEAELEDRIGGNTEQDSTIKAAAAYFAFTDYLHFGEDSAEIWPSQPEKVAQSDGPFAPLASLLDYVGEGKGMAELKQHLYDPDPKYQELLKKAITASPIRHVSEHSGPFVWCMGFLIVGSGPHGTECPDVPGLCTAWSKGTAAVQYPGNIWRRPGSSPGSGRVSDCQSMRPAHGLSVSDFKSPA